HPIIITSTETSSSTDLQQQLYFKMKISLQDQANDLALWEVLKHKFEKPSTSNISCKEDEIHLHHDDHQEDDAPLEGEKRKQQQQEWDAWVEETVIDEDGEIPEDETPEIITELQEVDKRVPTIFDYERMRATLNDVLSNQFKKEEEITEVVRITTDQPHGLDFMEQIIMMRENDKPESFSEADFKYLNKNDIEGQLSRNQVDEFINNIHQKSCIEAHEPYSIVDKPSTGLIYLNSKDEK
ncbi:hypothetical protein Tco_1096272, partial [Tanacetum coccineum]